MSIFESYPDLILSLAKLTSAFLIALAVAPFLKRPALRATFWAAVLMILPTVILATHGRSILNILPQLPAIPGIKDVHAIPPPSELAVTATPLENGTAIIPAASPALSTTNVFEAPRVAPKAPKRETNWFGVVFFSGLAVSLLSITISVLRVRIVSKRLACGTPMDIWARIMPHDSALFPLYFTSSPSAPFTAGLIHSAVLLPESASNWSPRRLRSTLHHEAAHIRRKDLLVRMLASLVRAVFWFHPLVWLAHRQLVSAQEEACDEIALAAGIPADEYAEDLLEAAKCSQAIFAHGLGMARWSQLGCRLRIILQTKNPEAKPLTMKTIAIVSLGIAATTFCLSTLGFSEAAEAAENPAERVGNPGMLELEGKLRRVIIPVLDFEDVTLEQAIDFIRLRTKELDVAQKDPANAGINFVIRKPIPADGAAVASARIASLRLRNVPLGVALKYICELTKTTYRVDEFAVTISPLAKPEGAHTAEPANGPGATIISKKLKEIIIPQIDFENTTLEEAIDFMRLRSLELDVAEKDPVKRGFNYVIHKPFAAEGQGDGAAVRELETSWPIIKRLRLREVPLGAALKYICEMTKTTYRVDEFAVMIIPMAD